MDGRTEQRETAGDAAVIIIENEAESVPVKEEKSDVTGLSYLDTCPVCCLNFHSREPQLLPCLHSFCKKCLPSPSRNLAMNAPTHSQADRTSKPLNVIRCPVCRQECMEVDVVENVLVKDSIEAPSSTVERSVQLCMTCDDNTEATGFCVNCVEYLCSTCVEAHQRVKFTREHTIRQKEEASQEVHRVSAQRPMFCDVHKQEPLKLFCETCDLLTCRDCQLVKHKDHNYQFLEDAYKCHKEHMESMTHQLQEKKKLIEDVSNSINNGLFQAAQNRSSVQNEIKKSICSLILEINKKGKMLMSHLEAVTKDHETVLRKQQEDIGYLSRHLDHVINFTKWATARNGGTALLFCKRLILFQIGNLLRAKCSTSFVPQSTVRFQCRSSYWASNVDLGSLVVESAPGNQLGCFQGISHHPPHPRQGPSVSPHSFAPGAPHSTLAQLQMQVDKLNPLAHWQPQPPPPPWTWYQSVRLQRTIPEPLQGGTLSHGMHPQPGRRFLVPPPSHISPSSSLLSPGFTPRSLRGMEGSSTNQPKPVDATSSSPLYANVTPLLINGDVTAPQSRQTIDPTCLNRRSDSGGPIYMLTRNFPQTLPPSLPHRNGKGEENSLEYAAESQEEKPGPVSWKTAETCEDGPSVKKRRRSSPQPIIVIKDEPDNNSSYALANQRANLPDSTGDQPQAVQHQDPLQESDEVLCAVCQTGGELLGCHKCTRVFHLPCHVPTLHKVPSGEWFCSFCCDMFVPEMEYESKSEAKTVKKESDSDGGLLPEDKQKCERLLLHLFCSDLSSDFPEPESPSDQKQRNLNQMDANNTLTLIGPMKLSAVKKRLEAKQCYQSPAEFVSDIRLVFENFAVKAETEVTMAGRKLKELFEEHLRIIFPDQTFPEIKQELTPTSPSDSIS